MSDKRLPSRKAVIRHAMQETEFTSNRDPKQSVFDWTIRGQMFTGFVYGALWMKEQARANTKKRKP